MELVKSAGVAHVFVIDTFDRSGFVPDWRAAELGPQPQLGLWAERRAGPGGDHLDRAAGDGANLRMK